MENIVITGVSTGIGYGLTKLFINKGDRVFGSVRKQNDADRLKIEFGEQFVPLIFDITDHEKLPSIAEEVKRQLAGEPLAALINNAGITVNGPLMHIPIDDLRRQFEVNVFSQIAVTQAFLPMLGANKDFKGIPGRVYIIGSISGKIGLPFVGPYCGSKFALEGLSDSLRREMLLYDIPVVLIEPGPIKTAIWGKSAGDEETDKFEGTDYGDAASRFKNIFMKEGENGMELDEFCRRFDRIHSTKKPKARYVIMHKKFKGFTIPSWLSDSTFDKLIGKQLGLSKQH